MPKEFLRELSRVYRDKLTKPDMFGRKKATPAEIKRAIDPTFEQQIDRYLPTEQDIQGKDETI